VRANSLQEIQPPMLSGDGSIKDSRCLHARTRIFHMMMDKDNISVFVIQCQTTDENAI